MKDNNLSLIVMPYHLAVMQADFTKLQLDALIIAVLKLQHQITALLNHQQSPDEAISRLVADHGVNPNMLRFPLNWKGKGVRGRYIRSLVEDTRVDGLGLRVIDATGDGSDCRLYLSVKMARHLLDMSKGYFYVSPQLCREMRSRYTVRLYWLMQAHSHQKGFTMSVSQLQAILCARTPFRDYASFERTAIVAPLSKLYGHCSAGQIPSYLLFCRLYNRHGQHYWTAAGSPMRGTGRPDALKFTIFSPSNGAPASAAVAASNRAAESGKGKGAADRKQEAGDSQSSAACGQGLADKKQAAAPSNNQRQSLAGDIVYDLLHDDLQLPEKLAECEAARVTDSMRQAFINHAIMLKEIIDEKRSRKQALKNQVAYILTCLHHFFEKQEARGGAAAEGEGKTGGEGGKSAVRVPANAESAGASGEGRANAGKAGANGVEFEYPVSWGVDLQSEHERFLVEKHFRKPVILTDYPKDIKAFYMKQNEDGRTVRAMDVLFPKIGEIIGGSEREESLEKLETRINELGMSRKNLEWYIDTRRFGSCPHSGFGLGFERLLLFVTGMSNIRDVIPFPRTPKNAEY